MRLFYARLDVKHNLLEIFENAFENFHKNLAKNALFLHIFQITLANHALIFRAFARKINHFSCFSPLKLILQISLFYDLISIDFHL